MYLCEEARGFAISTHTTHYTSNWKWHKIAMSLCEPRPFLSVYPIKYEMWFLFIWALLFFREQQMSTGEIVYSKCEYINMCVVVVDWKRRVFFLFLPFEWKNDRANERDRVLIRNTMRSWCLSKMNVLYVCFQFLKLTKMKMKIRSVNIKWQWYEKRENKREPQ